MSVIIINYRVLDKVLSRALNVYFPWWVYNLWKYVNLTFPTFTLPAPPLFTFLLTPLPSYIYLYTHTHISIYKTNPPRVLHSKHICLCSLASQITLHPPLIIFPTFLPFPISTLYHLSSCLPFPPLQAKFLLPWLPLFNCLIVLYEHLKKRNFPEHSKERKERKKFKNVKVALLREHQPPTTENNGK